MDKNATEEKSWRQNPFKVRMDENNRRRNRNNTINPRIQEDALFDG